MSDSLRMLLTQSIDYAGVFPPAQLTLDQALGNYADYRQQPDEWMLGRFVCRVDALSVLRAQARRMHDTPIPVAVVGTDMHSDFQIVDQLVQAHENDVKVESLDLKLPADALEFEIESLGSFLDGISKELSASGLHGMDVFLEVPSGQDWESRVTRLLQAIEAGRHTRLGMKIRLGGLSAGDTPSPQQVAFFIDSCRAAGVHWKATAGLHHPLPRPSSSGNESQFGFLNLLAAAVLTSVHRLPQSQITSILKETLISQFSFDQGSFSWGDFRVTLPDIQHGRHQSMRSFGSCSFDQPRDGLRHLKLLAWIPFHEPEARPRHDFDHRSKST